MSKKIGQNLLSESFTKYEMFAIDQYPFIGLDGESMSFG